MRVLYLATGNDNHPSRNAVTNLTLVNMEHEHEQVKAAVDKAIEADAVETKKVEEEAAAQDEALDAEVVGKCRQQDKTIGLMFK